MRMTRLYVLIPTGSLVTPYSTDIGECAYKVQNWSTKWKFFTMFCSTLVSFTQGFGPLALAPMFPYLIEEFDSNLTDVVQFTGIAILVLGFSNFIWSAKILQQKPRK
jgi:hypothetical protein